MNDDIYARAAAIAARDGVNMTTAMDRARGITGDLRLFSARHAEYLPARDTFTLIYEPEWNEEATDEDHASAVRHFAAEHGIDSAHTEAFLAELMPGDLQWQNVIAVPVDRLPDAYRTLLLDIAGTPSGDDDTFDYWPSGVLLAADLARASGVDEQEVSDVASRALQDTAWTFEDLGLPW